MKKILSIVLAAMMLLSVGIACAETAEATAAEPTVVRYDAQTDITYILPEDYAVSSTEFSGQMVIIDLKTLADKPELVLVVGLDEEYADLNKLNDLSDEDLQAYIDTLCEDWGTVETYVVNTDYDTKFVLLDEVSADIDQCQITGIYKGYTITLYLIRTNGTQVTEDDYNAAMKFLSEVWIKDGTEAAAE